MSVLTQRTNNSRWSGHVRFVPILLQKSKIEQPQKFRESPSLDFSATAVSLFNATLEVRDRFWMKRYDPPASPRANASVAPGNFLHRLKKCFCNNICQKRLMLIQRKGLRLMTVFAAGQNGKKGIGPI